MHVPRSTARSSLLLLLVPWVFPFWPCASADSPDERREHAFELLADGKADRAAEEFDALLKIEPDDAAAMEGRIRSLLALQRWRTALGEARDYAERSPGASRARSALGEALFRAGLFQEIGPLLGEPASGGSASGRELVVLGRLRQAEGREAEAVELMTRAVALAPNDRDVLFWASGATATRQQAVERLERYLDLSEGDDPDRREAARSGIGVLRALGERSVWVAEHRPERDEIPLKRIWDPATGTTLGFVVGVKLDEARKPVPVLLDSGSPGLFVIRRAARKRGFEPLAEQSQFGGGGAGRHRTDRGLFATASIGGLRFSQVLASSNKQELDPYGRYHGMVGLGVFHGYRVTLDLARERLMLEPPGETAEGEPYWTVEGQWLVRGEVDHPSPGLFLFDTGATRSILNAELLADFPEARLGTPVRIRGFGGLVEGARQLHGVDLSYQGLSTRNAPLSVVDLSDRSRLGGVEIAGFFGLDLLAASRIVIDTTRRRIAVYPAEP